MILGTKLHLGIISSFGKKSFSSLISLLIYCPRWILYAISHVLVVALKMPLFFMSLAIMVYAVFVQNVK